MPVSKLRLLFCFLVPGGLAAGCSTLPDLPLGLCGNGVLDPGESCDRRGPDCGAPDGPAPCRFLCASGSCARAGDVCGRDHVCRHATGTYTLGPLLGISGDRFEVLDLDGDGRPDIADRGTRQMTLYRNDGRGVFTLYGAGSASPDSSVRRAFSAGRLGTADPRTVITAISPATLDLYTATSDRKVVPLMFATTLLPAGGRQQFLGGIRFGNGEPTLPLFFDPDAAGLFALDLDRPDAPVTLSLAPCGATTHSTVLGTTVDRPAAGSQIAVLIDGKKACAVSASRAAAGSPPQLTLAALGTDGVAAWSADYTLSYPVLGDLKGSGSFDVLAVATRMDATHMPEYHLAEWMHDPMASGFLSPVVSAPYDFYAPPFIIGADFNGDGLVDLADFDSLYLNSGLSGGYAFAKAVGVDANLFGTGKAMAAGDINRDGTTDLILSDTRGQGATICAGDGKAPPAFTCLEVPTGLSSIGSFVLADVNGDRTNDIVAVADPTDPAAPTDGGVGSGDIRARLSVIFGRAYGLPDATPEPIAAWRSTTLGATRSPAPRDPRGYQLQGIAESLLVALRVDNGLGISIGHAVNGGRPAFGLPIGAFEARFLGGQLYLLRCDLGKAGYYTDCKVQVFGGDGGAVFASQDVRPFSRSLAAPADAYSTGVRFAGVPGDKLPSVIWVESNSLFVGHIGSKQVVVTEVPSPVSLDGYSLLESVDIDGPADPAGDGRSELVVMVPSQTTMDCQLMLGRTAAGAAAPTALTALATIPNCVHGVGASNDPSFGVGRPFFIPHRGVGGAAPYDLVATVRGSDGRAHFAVMAVQPDGTYAAPDLDPKLFHPAGGGTAVAALDASADYRSISSNDMNDDNIADIVFRTPNGVVTALADTD